MMSFQPEYSFSIIPLDSLFHSFIRFFIIPASIIGSLFILIYDYADYNSHSIYIVEVLCLTLAIVMFTFTEIGFLQQERYSCVTVVLGCLSVMASNISVAVITYNDPALTELLNKNYFFLATRIFITALWASVISVYYIKNRLHFYPRENKGNPDAISEDESWGETESPRERRSRESWIVSRLKNNVVEVDEEPDFLE